MPPWKACFERWRGRTRRSEPAPYGYSHPLSLSITATWLPHLARGDDRHGRKNDAGRKERPPRELPVPKGPRKEHRHQGVNVSVRRDHGRGGHLEEPNVSRESNDGAKEEK